MRKKHPNGSHIASTLISSTCQHPRFQGQQHPGGKAFVNGQSPAFEVAPFSSKWLALRGALQPCWDFRHLREGFQALDSNKWILQSWARVSPFRMLQVLVGDCKQQRVTWKVGIVTTVLSPYTPKQLLLLSNSILHVRVHTRACSSSSEYQHSSLRRVVSKEVYTTTPGRQRKDCWILNLNLNNNAYGLNEFKLFQLHLG